MVIGLGIGEFIHIYGEADRVVKKAKKMIDILAQRKKTKRV